MGRTDATLKHFVITGEATPDLHWVVISRGAYPGSGTRPRRTGTAGRRWSPIPFNLLDANEDEVNQK